MNIHVRVHVVIETNREEKNVHILVYCMYVIPSFVLFNVLIKFSLWPN